MMGRLHPSHRIPKSSPYSNCLLPSRGKPEFPRPSRVDAVDNYPDGRATFHLANGSRYTISPDQKSSAEHYWGTIYFAEWYHPASSSGNCNCVIKATEFLPPGKTRERDLRTEYRRPKQDFEREVIAFRRMDHGNVLRMYDFWEWDGRGYISMKR